jgi:polyferredoxin
MTTAYPPYPEKQNVHATREILRMVGAYSLFIALVALLLWGLYEGVEYWTHLMAIIGAITVAIIGVIFILLVFVAVGAYFERKNARLK